MSCHAFGWESSRCAPKLTWDDASRFLTDPHDVKLLTWGLKLSRKVRPPSSLLLPLTRSALTPTLSQVAETEPLKSMLVKPFRPDHPGFPVFPDTEKFTDEEIGEWIRGHAEVLYHPVRGSSAFSPPYF